MEHQYDLWHVSKGAVTKKVNEAAKKKASNDLGEWTQSLSNHFWWSSATCDGDSKVFKLVYYFNQIYNKVETFQGVLFTFCPMVHL